MADTNTVPQEPALPCLHQDRWYQRTWASFLKVKILVFKLLVSCTIHGLAWWSVPYFYALSWGVLVMWGVQSFFETSWSYVLSNVRVIFPRNGNRLYYAIVYGIVNMFRFTGIPYVYGAIGSWYKKRAETSNLLAKISDLSKSLDSDYLVQTIRHDSGGETFFSERLLVNKNSVLHRALAFNKFLTRLKPTNTIEFCYRMYDADLYGRNRATILFQFLELHGLCLTDFDMKVLENDYFLEQFTKALASLHADLATVQEGTLRPQVLQPTAETEFTKFVKTTFKFDIHSLPEPLVRYGIFGIGLIGLMVGFKTGMSITPVQNFFNSLANYARQVHFTNGGYNAIKPMLESYSNLIASTLGYVSLTEEEQKKQSTLDRLTDYGKRLQKLMNDIMTKPSLLVDLPNFQNELLEQLHTAEAMMKEFADCPKSMYNARLIMDRIKENHRLLLQIWKEIAISSGSKIEPTVLCLYGKTFAGKSWMIKEVVKRLAALHGHALTQYVRNRSDEFMSNYQAAHVFNVDDFGQHTNHLDHSELIDECTPTAFGLNKADLGSKGQPFCSWYIILTTNLEYIYESNTVTDLAALNRRRGKCIRVTNNWVDRFVDETGHYPSKAQMTQASKNGLMNVTYDEYPSVPSCMLPSAPKRFAYKSKRGGHLVDVNGDDLVENVRYTPIGLDQIAQDLFREHKIKRLEYEGTLESSARVMTNGVMANLAALLGPRSSSMESLGSENSEEAGAVGGEALDPQTAVLHQPPQRSSVLALGPPGLGKTHRMKACFESHREEGAVWCEATSFSIPDGASYFYINDITKTKECFLEVEKFICDYYDGVYPSIKHVIMSANRGYMEEYEPNAERLSRFIRRCDVYVLDFNRGRASRWVDGALTDAQWFSDSIASGAKHSTLVSVHQRGTLTSFSHWIGAMDLIPPIRDDVIYNGLVYIPDGEWDYEVELDYSMAEIFNEALKNKTRIVTSLMDPGNWKKGNVISAGANVYSLCGKIFDLFKGFAEGEGQFLPGRRHLSSVLTLINNEKLVHNVPLSGVLRLKDVWFGIVTNSKLQLVIGLVKTDIPDIQRELNSDRTAMDPGTRMMHMLLNRFPNLADTANSQISAINELTTSISIRAGKQKFGVLINTLALVSQFLCTLFTLKDIHDASATLSDRRDAARRCEFYECMDEEDEFEEQVAAAGNGIQDKRAARVGAKMLRQVAAAGNGIQDKRAARVGAKMLRQDFTTKSSGTLMPHRALGDERLDELTITSAPPVCRKTLVAQCKGLKEATIHKNRRVFFFADNQYVYSGRNLIANPMTGYVKELMDMINTQHNWDFNSAMVTFYDATRAGIGMHKDDETQIDSDHPIVGFQVGEPRTLRVERDEDGKIFKVPLCEGQMQVYHPEFQTLYRHGVAGYMSSKTDYAISVTLRRLVSLEAQASHDPLQGTIEARVVANQRSLIDKEGKHLSHCLFIKGTLAVANKHAMDNAVAVDIGGKHYAFEWREVKRRYPTDIVVLKVNGCQEFKDITSSIQSSRDTYTYTGRPATICVGQPDNTIKVAQVQIQEKVIREIGSIGKVHGFLAVGALQGYGSKGKCLTVAGDCGSAWVLNDRSNHRPIIAIHSAGDESSSFASVLVIEDLLRAFPMPTQCAEVKVQPLKHQRIMPVDSHPDLCDTLEMLKEGCVVGQTDQVIKLQKRTRLWRSPLNVTKTPYVPFVPDEKEPAVFSNADTRVPEEYFENDGDVYWDQALKWLKPQEPCKVSEEYVKQFLQELGEDIGNKLLRQGVSTKVCSLLEALNGCTSYKHSNPLHRGTSAGYPWQVDFRNGKMDALHFDEERQIWDLSDGRHGTDLNAAVSAILSAASQHRKTGVVFVCRQKDEVRDLKKIYELPKTRTFASGPVDFNLAWRRYFHAIECALMEMEESCFAQGIDPLSLDWHRMVLRLLAHNTKGFDFDTPNFDSTIRNMVMRNMYIFYDAIAQICDAHWKPMDRVIRQGLYMQLAEPLMVLGEKIIAMVNAKASGQPGTTSDNGVVSKLYLVSAWDYIFEDDPEIPKGVQGFNENCGDIIQGDDNTITPGVTVADRFNFTTVKKALKHLWGHEITPSQKDAPDYTLKPITELSFLSRDFVEVGGYWRGRLQLSSIDKMINWTQVASPHLPYVDTHRVNFDLEAIESTIDSVEKEMVLHGKTKYEAMAKHLSECLRRLNSSRVVKGWKRACQLINPPIPESFDE